MAPFDQAAWCDPGSANFIPGDLTPRQKMLGAVVRSVLKPGGQAATREAIVAQLGPSEDSELFASMGHDLIYHLGPQHDSIFAIDEDWLLIWLDESGRFVRFEIRAD